MIPSAFGLAALFDLLRKQQVEVFPRRMERLNSGQSGSVKARKKKKVQRQNRRAGRNAMKGRR